MRIVACGVREFGLLGIAALLWSSSVAAQAAPQPPAPAAAPVDDASAPPEPTAVVSGETIERKLSTLVGKSAGLTSKEAAKRALVSNAAVRVREAEIAAAEAETGRVVYTSLPRLSLLARYTRMSPVGDQPLGPDELFLVASGQEGVLPAGTPLVGVQATVLGVPEVLDHYLLQANLTVPLSDYLLSTSSALDSAHLNEHAARLNREAAKLDVALRAKLLYYDWARARLQVVVAEESVVQRRASLAISKTALSGGRATNADVLNAESTVAVAELNAERSRKQAVLAEGRLRVAMHEKAGSYGIGEDLFAVQPKARAQKLELLIAEARRNRLELRALEQANRALAEKSTVTNARGLPRLEAFGNAYYANPNHRYFPAEPEWRATWDVGVQLSWSPNDLGTAGTDTRVIEAERAKLQAQTDTIADQIEEQVLEAQASLQEAEIGVETAQRNLVAAEEAYRVQRLFYENGRGTTLDLLDKETRVLLARIEMVNMRVAQHMARVALEHAVGRDVAKDALR